MTKVKLRKSNRGNAVRRTVVLVASINVITCPVLGSQSVKLDDPLIEQVNFQNSVVFLL